jgi:hypothetical protein
MKLDIWEAILSILDVGGIFQYERYEIRDRNGQLHREDGPAVIYPNGSYHWYRNGALHREDGPAVILPNGNQYWYRNDMYHRDDGPALIYQDGTQKWYLNGQLIRVKDK